LTVPDDHILYYSPLKKFIEFDFPIRTGECEICNRSICNSDITQTQLHHYKYDDNDPLAHTVEVCASCHKDLDPAMRFHARVKKPNLHTKHKF
jgi:hypothetical protein